MIGSFIVGKVVPVTPRRGVMHVMRTMDGKLAWDKNASVVPAVTTVETNPDPNASCALSLRPMMSVSLERDKPLFLLEGVVGVRARGGKGRKHVGSDRDFRASYTLKNVGCKTKQSFNNMRLMFAELTFYG